MSLYALYYDDKRQFIAVFDKAQQALVMGKLISKSRQRPVIIVFNNADGTTNLCWRFQNGVQIEIEAAPWTAVIAPSAPGKTASQPDS